MRIPVFLIISLMLIVNSCNQSPPARSIDLKELTVEDIHAAYRAGTYTSEQLVQAYFNQMDSVNPAIHAITYRNPDALAQARALDQEFKETGTLRPLHGIPMIVKDNYETAGLPTTAGSMALVNFIPETNAWMVQQLIDAGAIILAKSNMAEWAFSPMHTQSSTFGITHNPYDTTRVPAGSSGGTAAAIAANIGVLGLGTDTGNSIRGPSSHCALVGMRPSLGLISRQGIVPLYLRNDVGGPMCRTVTDAARVIQATAGPDPGDALTYFGEGYVKPDYLSYLRKDGLQGKRIGVLRILTQDMDPGIRPLFEQAINDLRRLGAEVLDSVEVPDFATLRQNQWCAEFRTDIETYLADRARIDSVQTIEDILRIGTKSDYTRRRLEYQRSHLDRPEGDIPCGTPFDDPLRLAFRKAIEQVMDDQLIDALIYPTWNYPPAHIDRFEEEYRGDNSQVIAPATGQPAFTVPMGFNPEGLPAGIQFLGRLFDEPTLIEIAFGYEQGTHHRLDARQQTSN
ncbi:MAG: amidase [Lewinellaceae bacterium]|nr:amidase [Lewinellaceae bacterium]